MYILERQFDVTQDGMPAVGRPVEDAVEDSDLVRASQHRRGAHGPLARPRLCAKR
jgi:hypothetical protein